MISIIIPTLNEEKFLPKLLDSLVAQSRRDFEVIVVDGGSKDKTVAKAKSYQKKISHLCVVISDRASLPYQRNLGVKEANGDWYAFIDADSVLLPYAIERMMHFITERRPKWFTTWCAPDSQLVNDSIFTLLANIFWESTLIMKRPVAPGPLNCVRKDIFLLTAGYNVEQQYNEDVEFGLRLDRLGIQLQFLRETIYIWSMRRIRHENKIKVMNQYILSMVPILLLKRPFKTMPGYEMGGHIYAKSKHIQSTLFKKYEEKFKTLLKEIFE